MNRILLTYLLFSSVSLSSLAQVSGNYLHNPETRHLYQHEAGAAQIAVQNMNELVISVSALQNEYADSYAAIFHITQVGSTAREADSLLTLRIDRFISGAVKQGLKKEDVIIDMLSMVPVYEVEVTRKLFSKTYNEIPAGFEIKKNIHIGYTDPNQLDRLITAAAFNEIYDLVKVDYFVNDVAAVYANLRVKATKLIEDKVAQFEVLGIPLEGQWRMAVDQEGIQYPVDRYVQYTTKTRPSFEAANKRASVNLQTAPVTLFYNKLSYAGFDIVENPEVIEPAVQFTYSISVKFQVVKEVPKEEPKIKTEIKNRYFLINPQGNPVELPAQ